MTKLLILLLICQLPHGFKEYRPGFSTPKGKVVAVEKKSLNAFARGQKTAIVLVVKQDCRGCRQMEKRLERVAKELREFRFSVMDEAESKRKWQRLPALVLYRDGREVDRRMGAMSEEKLEDWIKGEGR
jgi:thioredoxin-like negative regulator of GroEL